MRFYLKPTFNTLHDPVNKYDNTEDKDSYFCRCFAIIGILEQLGIVTRVCEMRIVTNCIKGVLDRNEKRNKLISGEYYWVSYWNYPRDKTVP